MPEYQATKITGETLSTSTTYATLGIPPTAEQFILYQPTADFRLSLVPALIDARFFNSAASAPSQYEGSGTLVAALTDRTTTGTGTTLDSALADNDFLYLCFSDPVRGIQITVGSANSTANTTFIAKYRKNDNTWAALSITDGTDSGGVALAQTGPLTWTAVTDWKRDILVGPTAITDNATTGERQTRSGFWVQLSWDEALDSDTEITNIWGINQAVDYGYFRTGVEYTFTCDKSQVGAIEVDLASGTDTMQVTWIRSVH
jgi:hypothetical protein